MGLQVFVYSNTARPECAFKNIKVVKDLIVFSLARSQLCDVEIRAESSYFLHMRRPSLTLVPWQHTNINHLAKLT